MKQVTMGMGICVLVACLLVGCTRADGDAPRNLNVMVVHSNTLLKHATDKINNFEKPEGSEYTFEIEVKEVFDNEPLIQQVSTQILSGKMPDILDLAGLPYEKYKDKGVLRGISQDEMLQMVSSYDKEVIEALLQENTMYEIPLTIQVPVMRVNRALSAQMPESIVSKQYTIDNFIEVLEAVEEVKPEGTYLLPKSASEYLTVYMLQLYYHTYPTYSEDEKSANLNKILTAVDELQKYEHPNFDMRDIVNNSRGEEDQVLFLPTFIDSYYALKEGYDYMPMVALDREIYTLYTYEMIGLADQQGDYIKNRQNEFIEYIFSEQVQYDMGVAARYLVVNEKARKNIGEFHLLKYPELEEDLFIIEDMIKKADIVIGQEYGIRKIIIESSLYAKGEQTKEKTIDEILKKMEAHQ